MDGTGRRESRIKEFLDEFNNSIIQPVPCGELLAKELRVYLSMCEQYFESKNIPIVVISKGVAVKIRHGEIKEIPQKGFLRLEQTIGPYVAAPILEAKSLNTGVETVSPWDYVRFYLFCKRA